MNVSNDGITMEAVLEQDLERINAKNK